MCKKIIFALFLSLFFSTSLLAKPLTLSLPEETMQNVLNQLTPLAIPTNSNTVEGTIVVQELKKIHFVTGGIEGEVTLRGEDIKLSTQLGDQRIYFNVGEIATSFFCEARLRFDKREQRLYITPFFKSLADGGKSSDALASALLALLNDKEIPLQIDSAKKIMAEVAGQGFSLSFAVEQLTIEPGVLSVFLQPTLDRGERE